MGKKKDVSPEKRREIFHELLSLSKEKVLPRGTISFVSKKHDFSRRTIERIWQKGGQEGNKRSNSGRKEKWTDEIVKSLIKEVPLEKRTSLRTLGQASGIPISILCRKRKKGLLSPSRSYPKPCLTESNDTVKEGIVLASL